MILLYLYYLCVFRTYCIIFKKILPGSFVWCQKEQFSYIVLQAGKVITVTVLAVSLIYKLEIKIYAVNSLILYCYQ